MTIRIDLSEKKLNVFTGRDAGENFAELYGLSGRADDVSVNVIIPDGVYTVTSSFFLGMFGPSIRKAGSEEGFLKTFAFQAPDHIANKIPDFIARALREKS